MSIFAIALCSLAFTAQGNDPVATINGENISSQYYYRRMEYLPGLGRRSQTGQFVEVMPAIATLDTLVTEMLILQMAAKKNLVPSDGDIDKEIAYRLRTKPNLTKDWLDTGRTMPELRQQIKVEVARFRLETDGFIATDSDIETNYNAVKSTRYLVPLRVQLKVISVRDEASKTKVDAGLASGKKFDEMAKTYSSDSTASRGGDFGVIPLDLLSDQVKDAIKDLKEGQRTAWLSVDSVFAKFEVEKVIPQSYIPLDDTVKEELRREIMLRKGAPKNSIGKMIREARQTASIKISSPVIDKAYREFLGLEKQAASSSGGQ